MTDKEYEEQKARVQKYIDKWFNSMGIGWYTVDIEWSAQTDRDEPDAAASTTVQWQYRQACVTFYLPVIARWEDDDKVEHTVVHEFSHILVAPIAQGAPVEMAMEHEYATECVARAIEFAYKAGEQKDDSESVLQ